MKPSPCRGVQFDELLQTRIVLTMVCPQLVLTNGKLLPAYCLPSTCSSRSQNDVKPMLNNSRLHAAVFPGRCSLGRSLLTQANRRDDVGGPGDSFPSSASGPLGIP